MKHSPGPFSKGQLRSCDLEILDARGIHIATVHCPIGEHGGVDPADTQDTNAALLVAAPELLKELRAVEWGGVGDLEEGGTEAACPSCGGGKSEGHNDGCALRAAIAKAGGLTNPDYTPPTNTGTNPLNLLRASHTQLMAAAEQAIALLEDEFLSAGPTADALRAAIATAKAVQA